MASWFTAVLVRGSCGEEGGRDDERMGDMLYRLIEAADAEEAYRKAIELGERLVDTYPEDDGTSWTLKFLGLADLVALADDKPADGAEVYSQILARHPSESVVAKEQLTVFEPDEPEESDDAEDQADGKAIEPR